MITTDRLSVIATSTLSKLLEREKIRELGLKYGDDELEANIDTLSQGYDVLADDESDAALKFKHQYLNLLDILGRDKPSPKPSSAKDLPSTHLPKTQSAQQTPATRTTNEQQQEQLFNYDDLMDQQDTHLDNLSHSLSNQYQLSSTMTNELGQHNELLQDLEIGLDDTQLRLGKSSTLLNRLNTKFKSNTSTYCITIIILVLILLILIFKV